MTRLTKVLTLAVLALGAAAGLVVADTKQRTDPKGDTKGKADSGFDLRSARASHSSGRLVHKVESWVKAGSGGVTLELDVGRKPGADFAVYRSRESGKTQVADARTGKRVAGARYKQLSNKSFQLTFDLGFDGDPSYRWRWRVYGPNGTYDLLPNKGWVKHDM